MFGLGFSEILFLAVLALIVIGPKQLPEVARTLGRFLNDLKRSTDGLKEEFRSQIDIDFDLRRNLFEEDLKIKRQHQEFQKNSPQLSKTEATPIVEPTTPAKKEES